jgi:hypothetical protein
MGDFVNALAMIGLLLSWSKRTRNLAQQQSQCPTGGYWLMKPMMDAPRTAQVKGADVLGNRE